MPVYRVNKENNYTIISNFVFHDKQLSWKAKGVLSQLLSLPDDWDYSAAGLETLSADGITATRAALIELEKYGYLTRRAIRERGKIVDWEYSIYEKPQVEKPQVEKPQVEKPQVEKRTQLSTKESRPYESNTKKENTDESKAPAELPTPKKATEAELTERFSRFWACYPRRISKGQALRAWMKISPNTELTEKIIAAVETAKKNDSRFREEKYTPHPATWLNGMEWENQYGAEAKEAESRDAKLDTEGFRTTIPDYAAERNNG